MKVILMKDRIVLECNDAYGARLIEQGRAVLQMSANEEPVPVEEKKTGGKTKKGDKE